MLQSTAIDGVYLLTPSRFSDHRGFFCESFRQSWFNGISDTHFIQDNHSYSKSKDTLRGLHFQIHPFAQAKLVRCTRGSIVDVAVDIRAGSPTFGKYVKAVLSAENGAQLFVPVGFAHGFLTLEDDCEVLYKTSNYYSKECDRGLAWDDPTINLDWALDGRTPILSEKDMAQPKLSDLGSLFHYA